jgi:hypothetical protein
MSALGGIADEAPEVEHVADVPLTDIHRERFVEVGEGGEALELCVLNHPSIGLSGVSLKADIGSPCNDFAV